MTKRAVPYFAVAEYEDGQPWITLEQLEGDDLILFGKVVGFDLPEGTTRDQAKNIRDFLTKNLVRISEAE